MKRLVAVLCGLLVLPAFAEVAPFYYTDAVEYADWEYDEDGMLIDEAEIVSEEVDAPQTPVIQSKAKPVATTSLRGGSRVAASPTNVVTRRGADSSSRAVASRTTTSRTTSSRATTSRTTTPSRTVTSRGSVSRAATNATSANSGATRRTSNTSRASVARATTGAATMKTATGNTTSVFEDNNLYRIGMRSSATATRVPTIRVGSAIVSTDVSSSGAKATTTAEMDELAELTDFCKAQYNACMDTFCNVLDDNQGRCSCSKNIQNYEKTEAALKAATEELQDVAQKIQYIGLSADEITTLFTETEAEVAMRGQNDTSQIKLSLDKVRDMIIDVQSGTASASSDGLLSFDLSNLLDFTISSTGFDISALFGTGISNTSSISNQRGETLYKTATARCKANVLNSCTAQGVDPSVITNSYDLEIDKQCIAYERSLSDSNDQMTATVRNAKTVLQKARLLVAQQKNQYDLRGCVSALDSCMQDDYVCGSDYEYCLDPTGKYIINGEVLVGSLPGKPLPEAADHPGLFKTSLYNTWCVDSNCNGTYAWDYDGKTGGSLANYINETLSTTGQKEVDLNMSKFLQYKIGYHDNKTGKNYGMCMPVLNRCQNYTYDKNGKYMPNNSVISEYLYRTMIQIKAAQDELLTEFAENCVSDVASCLSANNYDTATNKNVPVNACKASIATCMSVNGNVTTEPTPAQMLAWADGVYNGTIAPATDANTGTGSSGNSSGNGGNSGNSGSGSGGNSSGDGGNSGNSGSGDSGSGSGGNSGTDSGSGSGSNSSGDSGSGTNSGGDSGNGGNSSGSTTTYSITWSCSNWASSGIPATTVNSGENVPTPDNGGNCPLAEGKAWGTWYCWTQAEPVTWWGGGVAAGDSLVNVNDNLKCKIDPKNQHKISYNCDGGDGNIPDYMCNSGDIVTLPDARQCGYKNGQVPTGWTDDVTTTVCDKGKIFKVKGWETPPQYTIRYTCNQYGGFMQGATQSVEAGSHPVMRDNADGCTLTNPNNAWARWVCWEIDQDGNIVQFYNENIGKNDNVLKGWVDLGARWAGANGVDSDMRCNVEAQSTYTVSYKCDENGAIVESASQKVIQGRTTTIKSSTEVCPNATGDFTGWLCGNDTKQANDEITVNAATTCVAQWNYTIAYWCGGEDVAGTPPDSQTAPGGSDVTLVDAEHNTCIAPSETEWTKWMCYEMDANGNFVRDQGGVDAIYKGDVPIGGVWQNIDTNLKCRPD